MKALRKRYVQLYQLHKRQLKSGIYVENGLIAIEFKYLKQLILRGK